MYFLNQNLYDSNNQKEWTKELSSMPKWAVDEKLYNCEKDNKQKDNRKDKQSRVR